jgi:hypothetical protein
LHKNEFDWFANESFFLAEDGGPGAGIEVLLFPTAILDRPPMIGLPEGTLCLGASPGNCSFSTGSLENHLYGPTRKHQEMTRQLDDCLRMVRKPDEDAARLACVWEEVHALKDAYEVNP